MRPRICSLYEREGRCRTVSERKKVLEWGNEWCSKLRHMTCADFVKWALKSVLSRTNAILSQYPFLGWLA
jgi:hypothetical protein